MSRNNWPEGANISQALNAVQHRLTARKVRLLACACVRADWRLLRAESSRRAVALAERFADRLVSDDRLQTAHAEAQAAVGRVRRQEQTAAATVAALSATLRLGDRYNVGVLGAALADLSRWGGRPGECRFVPLLRDLVRPTSRPAALPAHWRTADVTALARQAYDGRDAVAPRVLGDALEDAGCDWPDLLAHCREPGRHVRGCWALDVVLGREHEE